MCVFSIRNATDAFKDGALIKDALLIMYACATIVFILELLGLDRKVMYMFRSSFFIVGITLFMLRLYFRRCLPYWVPSSIRTGVYDQYMLHVQPWMDYINPISPNETNKGDVNSLIAAADKYMTEYLTADIPPDDNLEEMAHVLGDPERLPILLETAKKSYCTENVHFLLACKVYEEDLAKILVEHSQSAHETLVQHTKKLYDLFVRPNCTMEVNVSAACRKQMEDAMELWSKDPLITLDIARGALRTDVCRRQHILDLAVKEISIMTYQNLWNKFRAEETIQDMELGEAVRRNTAFNSGKIFVAE